MILRKNICKTISSHKAISSHKDHSAKTSLPARKQLCEAYKRLGENGSINTDEGNLLKPSVAHMTLRQCEEYCTATQDCKSFTHCPHDYNRCSLFDRQVMGNQPTKWNSYCSYYNRAKNPHPLDVRQKGI